MSGIRNGNNFRLYYSAAYGTPSWQSIGLIQDITMSRTRENTKIKLRGVEEEIGIGSKVNRDVKGPLIYDGDSALLETLEDAFEAGTKIVLYVSDGDIAVEATRGRMGWYEIVDFTLTAPIDGETTIDFEAVPAYVENEPNVAMTAGS